MSDFELTGDTLDTSDDIGSISSTLDTLDIGESAQKPSKLEDSLASVTYGELVDSIRACRLKVYEYRDYLTPRTSPPSEEDWPWSFVSKVDDLSDAKGKGRDFLVYAGFLYQRNFRLSPSPSFRSPSYGDTYARPSSGSGGGSGSFASAYSSQRTAVALKESVRSIHRSGNRPALIGAFLKEIRFITRLESCRNIISMFGVAFIGVGDEVKPALVLELALSNLTEFIKEGFNGTSVSWNLKTLFASQICDALQALHSHGFIHADVKGQNVLIFSHKKSEFCAKLSDFGNCVPLNATAPYIAAGTQYYLAPECLVLDNSIIPSSHRAWGDLYGNAQYRDIYAFGLLVWELATNCECPPFFDLSTDAVDVVQMKHSDSDQAMGYLLDRVPPHTPTHLRGVISGALRTNPQKRALLIDIGREFEQVLSLQTESISRSVRNENPPNEESTFNIPWPLQRRLYKESFEPSNRSGIDAKIYLAYCYHFCATHDDEGAARDHALEALRSVAKVDPFHFTKDSKLTPLRALMEHQDWEGLSKILPAPDEECTSEQYLQHIYSYGWRKLLLEVCMAGCWMTKLRNKIFYEDSLPDNFVSIRTWSENVAVACIRLLSEDGRVENIGLTMGDYERFTVLHLACLTGKPRIVRMLIDLGADVHAHLTDADTARTALHLCCQEQSVPDDLSTEVAKILVEHQPDVMHAVVPDSLYTPLRFAVESQKQQLCQYLIASGADVSARAEYSTTVLQQCAYLQRSAYNRSMALEPSVALELATVILATGKVSQEDKDTALVYATVEWDELYDMAKLLLEYRASPNAVVHVPWLGRGSTYTALKAAVFRNHIRIYYLLMEQDDIVVDASELLGVALEFERTSDMIPRLLEKGATFPFSYIIDTSVDIEPVDASKLPSEEEIFITALRYALAILKGFPTGWQLAKSDNNGVKIFTNASWHARLTVRPESEITFGVLWDKMRMKEVIAVTDCKSIPSIEKVSNIKQLSRSQSVWSISYRFPFSGTSLHDFTVLQLSYFEAQIRTGMIVSIPVIDPSKDDKEEDIRGVYASVERIKQLEDGSMEWMMVIMSVPDEDGKIPDCILEATMNNRWQSMNRVSTNE